jgi:hypothetical protein
MNQTTIQVLMRAADYGLKLGREAPDTLNIEPVKRCPPDFADILRLYKPRLLSLLRLPFVMVFSENIGETLFFAQDEATKAALVEGGAEAWSIYTKNELRILVAHNRIAPLSIAELRKLHEIKRTFHGRIAK